jgi:hypothetical protein
LLYLKINGIEKDNRVYALQWPILPFFNEGENFIGNIGNEGRRDVNPIKVSQVVLNVSRAYAFGIQSYDLVFNTCHVRLMFLHDQGRPLEYSSISNGLLSFVFCLLLLDYQRAE